MILNWKDIRNPAKGGAEVIAFEFAKRLVKEGHRVTYLSRSFPHALAEEMIEGVQIIRRGSPLTVYFHAYLYYKSLKKKPDKVIDMVNTICWQTSLYVPKKNRVMYVNQLAQEVLFYELPWPISLISYLLERLEYFSYKNTQVICYSDSTKNDLMQFGIPEKNIEIFPMGLDHTRYVPGNKKSKMPLFLFVARLVKMKRAALCIEALEILRNEYPDSKLAIIGNGPEEKNLENLAKKLKLEKHVIFVNKDNFFLSRTTGDIKIAYMQEAWALLLPSVKEGWGMVVTEAAACGTPSIVSDVTGVRDSVRNGVSGTILS
ncbi:MAG TPA: glycosyltransferase family 4 protein, partial [Candidatus Saccharimonadales bacterium]|nr:glycosyltransferase family 4 protein [Candidatus Saccharimonadales bacterium]